MPRINDLSAVTAFSSGDVIALDGSAGTRQITVENAAVEFAGSISAMQHRNIYRGASLGSAPTSAQLSAISAGTFDDIYIGDYWTVSGAKYVVADMDYWYRCGDTDFAKHHLVMVPATNLYSATMNDSNTTEGGYVGSLMYTENLEDAKTTISAAFGDNVLTHREYLINAVTNGYPSAGAWYDSTVELMNEIMVYGSYIRAAVNAGSAAPATTTTIDKSQLALYRLSPRELQTRSAFWLRDVVSASVFARVYINGAASNDNASYSYGVRPVFALGVA